MTLPYSFNFLGFGVFQAAEVKFYIKELLQVGDARMMVISSSPSQDHSYTSVDGEEEYPEPTALPPPCRMPRTTSQPHPPPAKKANHSPTSSVDEAFSDDSYDSDVAR